MDSPIMKEKLRRLAELLFGPSQNQYGKGADPAGKLSQRPVQTRAEAHDERPES